MKKQQSFTLIGKTIDDILKGTEYFTCKRTRTKLKISACIEMQTRERGSFIKGYDINRVPDECVKCPQGQENLKTFNNNNS